MINIGNIIYMADGPMGVIRRFVEYKPGKYLAAVQKEGDNKFFPVYFEVENADCGEIANVEPDYVYFADAYRAIEYGIRHI